jgi:hypothetical protein
MHIGLLIKYLLLSSVFNGPSIFSTDFEKSPEAQFHKNLSSGSQVVPCGWADRHDEANSHTFCNFANMPKKLK